MKFKDFRYERPDYEQTAGRMNELIDAMEKAKDASSFLDAFWKLNDIRIHLHTMIILAQVRHTIDTVDPYYETENSYWNETSPKYEGIENRMNAVTLKAPFREDLLKEIPETFFRLAECQMKSYSDAIVDDMIEENRLQTAYGKLKASAKIPFDGKIMNLAEIAAETESLDRDHRKAAFDAKMQFYADHEAEFDDIYDQMVRVRDRMARKLGYQDYVELAYYRMNRLDYDRDMVAGYRKQILDNVTPLASEIYEEQRKRLGYDQLACYDLGVQFASGNAKPHGTAEELVQDAVQMYHAMSPETGKFIDLMHDNDLWDLVSRPNKEMGGYETEIPEFHVPFIFSNFNGTHDDVETLTHEAGHAFQTYLADEIRIPDVMTPTMESAEIDSMSMEFFTYPWMDLFFGNEADKFRYGHMCGTITFLPYGVLVDHFQEEVYTHPEWSPAERKACWRKLEKMYQPYKNYEGCDILERGCWWYQQGHIFQSPFYYIDYTLAQVCAQEFFIRMDEKDPDYWKDYLHLLKLGGTKSFTNLVKEAGLAVPFEEGTVEKVMAYLRRKLSEADPSAF